MEKISLWIKICSVCAVVSAVLTSLVPEGRLKNTYKIICALVMLFAFFSFFSSERSVDLSFSDNAEAEISMSEKNEEILVDEGERMMNNIIENKLYEGGIEGECKTEMSMIDDTLKYDRIYLYGRFSEGEKEKAKEIIHNLIKEECEVIFVNNNE